MFGRGPLTTEQPSGQQPLSPLRDFRLLLMLFIGLRLSLLVGFDLSGLIAYGDFTNYYRVAEITRVTGRLPFIGYWVEYPPLFGWTNFGLYQLLITWGGSSEHAYYYALSLLVLLADAGNLWLMHRIGGRLYGPERGLDIAWMYALLGVPSVLMTWDIEPVIAFFMLQGLWWLLEGQDIRSALAIATGALIKVTPGLLLPVVWRFRPLKRSLVYTVLLAGLGIGAYLPFLILSPAFGFASLQAQWSKSSWQTIWALLDGNLITGNFGPLVERLDPARAAGMIGHPPAIPPWLTLIVFGGVYLYLFTRPLRRTDLSVVAFLGVTWCVFLLWSKGWSTQWMQMLIPLLLLVFPTREGVLAILAFSLVNFLEWPLMLSRGALWGLYLTVPVRTLLIGGFLIAFYRQCRISPAEGPPAQAGRLP